MEKILKRTDGTKIKVIMSLIGLSPNELSVSVSICESGKRTFRPAINTDDHAYRTLGLKERREFLKEETLKHITITELDEMKQEFISRIGYSFSD